jgi:hypothetical protein
LEGGSEGVNVVDSELDLHFAIGSHAASIKKRCLRYIVPKTLKDGLARYPWNVLFRAF